MILRTCTRPHSKQYHVRSAAQGVKSKQRCSNDRGKWGKRRKKEEARLAASICFQWKFFLRWNKKISTLEYALTYYPNFLKKIYPVYHRTTHLCRVSYPRHCSSRNIAHSATAYHCVAEPSWWSLTDMMMSGFKILDDERFVDYIHTRWKILSYNSSLLAHILLLQRSWSDIFCVVFSIQLFPSACHGSSPVATSQECNL